MEKTTLTVSNVMAAVMLMLLSLPSCSWVTPHENFKAHMSHNVGMRIDDFRGDNWAIPKYLVNTIQLPNGNAENEYEFRGTCSYFFEYDPKTNVIVGWRFEGNERDCEIVP